MKNISLITPAISSLVVAAMMPMVSQGREVARFTMENSADKITETVSHNSFDINSVHPAENVDGAIGKALRFDGYTTFVDAKVGNIIPEGSKKMTVSVWFAVETYPVIMIDVNTPEQAAIATCLNETAKTGFGFFIGIDGKYSFKTYVGGWPLELKVDKPLGRYEWTNLTAVIDTEARTARLYNNGIEVASSKANGNVAVPSSVMRIGRSFNERFSGPFCLTSFNGIIDDITIWDEALTPAAIASWKAENDAALSVPSTRFADDPMRPTFHGMPGANWTNETHGLTFYNGRYHLFFQKNANGPYMARLHWGHLSSDNLYDWTEEQIALTPGASFDIKGCWSGCVFTDRELTKGKPSIIYTAVDYTRATIAQANPLDDDLVNWDKVPVPVINGRPNGLSDDFRDPFFFRTDNGAYIMVGSGKGGIGTTTLHAYNPTTGTWSNDGRTFFSGSDASTCGTFWEMPNVTRIGDKWLFTVTPLNTAKGVAALYWTGSINPDGTFKPDKTAPSNIELTGFARDGYGMLSPTIYQKDGKTIALGIVPDKLPSQANHDLGYAHTYSLPREWTLDSDGSLCQKPYSGLTAMRSDNSFARSSFTLDGSLDLGGMSGRSVELSGEFTVTGGKCGFTLLDDGSSSVKVYYDGATNEIVVDNRSVDRLINDSGVFDGHYHSILPRQLAKGETIKINLFFDHSILDIFINDRWASSVRVFANGKTTENVTAFADVPNQVHAINAWTLNPTGAGSGIGAVTPDSNPIDLTVDNGLLSYSNVNGPAVLSIYSISGSKVVGRYINHPSGTIDIPLSGLHIVTLLTTGGTTTAKIIF